MLVDYMRVNYFSSKTTICRKLQFLTDIDVQLDHDVYHMTIKCITNIL